MRKILLDTNAYAAFKQGNKDVLAILQRADIVGISVIVLGELVAGFHAGTQSKKNLDELNLFLNSPRIQLFPIDETTVTFYASVYASLRRKGKPIPSNDLWIAATALQQGCGLLTFDAHFDKIDNLVLVHGLEEIFI